MTPEEKVLSPEAITGFAAQGYVYLPQAFTRADALAIQDAIWSQMQATGIDRHESSTWPAGAWRGVKDKPELERGIAAPRLCGAINQLLGPENWRLPSRWGGYLISFPQGAPHEWQLTSDNWHWDDTLVNHFGNGSTGLFILTLFSEIRSHGGGTLLVAGSHRLIEQYYQRLSPADQQLKQKPLKERFAQSQPWLAELTSETGPAADRAQRFMAAPEVVDGVPVQVIEVIGEPGDAYLCHPAIYHAASPNHAELPRFMRVKGLLKQM